MFISTLTDLLTAEQLGRLHHLLGSVTFIDGRVSGGTDSTKRNLELEPDTRAYLDVLKLTESALRSSMEFHFTAFPRYITRPIISRYDTGMFYKEHTDFPVAHFLDALNPAPHRALAPFGTQFVRTDLSMTLFLSDPATYEGGELCFEGPGGMLRYKLTAGSAVLYPTGAPHSVSLVTRGSRLAAIFWIQSVFPQEPQRRAVYDAHQLLKSVERALPGSPLVEQAERNLHSIMRLFALV